MLKENIEILKKGGVGVIPTDTIYGIACRAFDKKALDRLFQIKGRDENKPPVVLISSIKDLDLFGVSLSDFEKKFISKYWPGKVSIIFKIKPELSFLDRDLGLAIRFPDDKKVTEYLKQTGPLATSSANIQNQPPAKNITEAKKYFAGEVDFYEDSGNLDSLPSTLVRIKGDKIEVFREGVVKIN
jgi:L-threonylcarbamoyladenylate synthase